MRELIDSLECAVTIIEAELKHIKAVIEKLIKLKETEQ